MVGASTWARVPHEIGEPDRVVLQAIADLAAVAVDRARLGSLAAERSEWFERLAHTDPLTALANTRTLGRVLELELARAARQGGEVSVALIDVDGLTGVFHAAYDLRETGILDFCDEIRCDSFLEWFNQHLPFPRRFSRSRRRNACPKAVCTARPNVSAPSQPIPSRTIAM